MSDPSTAAPDNNLTDEPGDEGDGSEPYTLQVMLLRGDPDSDPTEVAGDAWQFDVSGDDEATIAALETLATEYGGDPSAPAPGQEAQQAVPGPAPGQPPQQVPGQQPAPQGGPAQAQPGQPSQAPPA